MEDELTERPPEMVACKECVHCDEDCGSESRQTRYLDFCACWHPDVMTKKFNPYHGDYVEIPCHDEADNFPNKDGKCQLFERRW